MSKHNRRHHWQANEDAGLGGVQKGKIPLMKSAIPNVGFLAGKAVLYRRIQGRQLEVFPRTFGNMLRIFIKINVFLLRKKLASIAWHIREFRDNCIIAFRKLTGKNNASNKK